ncbi:MAG TPA: hypothetical protein VFD70_27315 [Anaerolineae bacterium]|nr:hypothetical protein [Anaerolineae bacterium]
MSVLDQIAYFQGRRDEVPNQELARKLVKARDRQGVREIAENLWNENANVQADCIKVLDEVGALEPKMIAPYADSFLKLLAGKNNRLVWGAMDALSAIAALEADAIFKHTAALENAIEHGSVITRDKGIKTLAIVAAHKEAYRKRIFPFLLHHLETCRSQDVPQHSESTLVAVNGKNKNEFIRILEKRLPNMPASRATRIKRVIKSALAK